jgi:DNA-binding NtrC family response regulator
MPGRRRILFVDDEPSIRLTLPAVLEEHGFEVSIAGSVAEALSKINSSRFDVLLSDLNIGEDGDGFRVVRAMRSIQPKCVTVILTGYPAFESALQGIVRTEEVEASFSLLQRCAGPRFNPSAVSASSK